MIASLLGTLREILDDRIHLESGPMIYELLVPAADVESLRAARGQSLTFHTIFYLEGDSSGGNITPRLIGFLRADDKKFFEKFITVKGIGPKKALKALVLPASEIAHAIESKDAKFLSQLPQIGKRTAETIIAELAGKVSAFALAGGKTSARTASAPLSRLAPIEEDAIAALMALGERRIDAENLLARAKQSNAEINSTNAFVREMLRLRN